MKSMLPTQPQEPADAPRCPRTTTTTTRHVVPPLLLLLLLVLTSTITTTDAFTSSPSLWLEVRNNRPLHPCPRGCSPLVGKLASRRGWLGWARRNKSATATPAATTYPPPVEEVDLQLLQAIEKIPKPVLLEEYPAYLQKIDRLRGYQRKIVARRHFLNATGNTSINAGHRETLEVNGSVVNGSGVNITVMASDAVGAAGSVRRRRRRWWPTLISEEMKVDMRVRSRVYLSDWTDGFGNLKKVIPGVLFLYFACLSPAVSFGTIASEITQGSLGIVEFLLSAGVSGMAYSVLCGQPMAFIAPTGLTLAFISGLFRFCTVSGVPFFPVYAWVGLWTSLFFVTLGLGGSSQLIRYCTRFTDEIFNALLSLNFIYEAVASLKRNFAEASDPMNLTMPFVSLLIAWGTFWSTLQVATFESSKYLNQKARTVIKDFGPFTIFILMAFLNQQSWLRKFSVPTLTVPGTLQLAGGRSLWVNLLGIPVYMRLLCALPAVLLTSLFFMDQNISVRVVNNPANKLQKGAAYNLDMVALGLITGAISLAGLPWMCGATVQSLNHVKAMTETRFNETTKEPEIVKVTETRLTGFVVHALVAGTVGLLPLLGYVPIPVVAGVFLFLGRKLMSGNSFLQRIRDMFVEQKRLPYDHPMNFIGRRKTNSFTVIQIACLLSLWMFKQNSATAVFFPSVIGLLMLMRATVLPRYFSEGELAFLGDPSPR